MQLGGHFVHARAGVDAPQRDLGPQQAGEGRARGRRAMGKPGAAHFGQARRGGDHHAVEGHLPGMQHGGDQGVGQAAQRAVQPPGLDIQAQQGSQEIITEVFHHMAEKPLLIAIVTIDIGLGPPGQRHDLVQRDVVIAPRQEEIGGHAQQLLAAVAAAPRDPAARQ